jgi:hypothetical protein
MIQKLIFIGFLLFGWLAVNAQSGPKGMVLISKQYEEKMDTVRQSDTIEVVAEVKLIFEGRALIASRNFGKTFIVRSSYVDYYQIEDEWYTQEVPLYEGREYKFQLKVSSLLRERLHCSGCTGNLPAVILDCTESTHQSKRNMLRFNKRTRDN